LLWNGLVGVRIGRDGSGFGADGKELSFFQIDEFDPRGEEKIRSLANPLAIATKIQGQPIDPRRGRDYLQTLDMRTGVLKTGWTQEFGGHTVKIQSETVVDPDTRAIGQRWRFEADAAVPVTQEAAYISQLETSASGQILKLSRQPIAVSAKWEGSAMGGKDGLKLLGNSDPAHFGASTWTFNYGQNPNESEVRPGGAGFKSVKPIPVPEVTFDHVQHAAADGWAKRWKTDIEIDGPVEDQQAVHSFLFYLRSAISPKGKMGISPFALSNVQYNGHVFWDADIWVLPALALIDPSVVKAIPAYREARFTAAKMNFTKGLSRTAKTETEVASPAIAEYPWESSVSGLEVAIGSSRAEYHISGSVLWSYEMAQSLGLTNPTSDFAKDGVRALAAFWRQRMTPPGSAKVAEHQILDVMSPDENHTGNNDLYTNLLAQWTVDQEFAKTGWPSDQERTAHDVPVLRLPKDDKSFLTYDDDKFKGYKQAAAVLGIYPLQYPPAEKQAKAMMERFADKVIKNGPAMTDSVHSIIWSRIGEKEKAYKAWKASWEDFTQSPFLLFSEKRLKPMTYFTTGAAGSLQSVLFGFLGIRIDYQKEPGAAWTTTLQNGTRWLSIKPNLPSQWKSVKFKNFTVLGRRYTLTVTPAAATVAPGE